MSKKRKAKAQWANTPRIKAALAELQLAFDHAAAAHGSTVKAMMMVVNGSDLGQAAAYEGCACSECQLVMVKAMRAAAEDAHENQIAARQKAFPVLVASKTSVH